MAHSQSFPPASFNRSPLVQLLASLQIPGGADSAQTFAEKLSHWVAWKDAIGLSSALDASPAARRSVEPLDQTAVAGIIDQVRRVRGELVAAIADDAWLAADAPDTVRRPGAMANATQDEPPMMEFASYRHRYMTHQRTMDERIDPLRAHVRAALTLASPALGRLAALDHAMEQALSAHQRRVLGQVATVLEKHFKRQHLPRACLPAQRQGRINPGSQQPPVAVGPTLQQVLLAELALRMQPVVGMVEAFGASAARHA